MPRFTIGQGMLVVAGAAVVSLLLRVAGLGPGLVVCAWASLGALAWLNCRRRADQVTL